MQKNGKFKIWWPQFRRVEKIVWEKNDPSIKRFYKRRNVPERGHKEKRPMYRQIEFSDRRNEESKILKCGSYHNLGSQKTKEMIITFDFIAWYIELQRIANSSIY